MVCLRSFWIYTSNWARCLGLGRRNHNIYTMCMIQKKKKKLKIHKVSTHTIFSPARPKYTKCRPLLSKIFRVNRGFIETNIHSYFFFNSSERLNRIFFGDGKRQVPAASSQEADGRSGVNQVTFTSPSKTTTRTSGFIFFVVVVGRGIKSGWIVSECDLVRMIY